MFTRRSAASPYLCPCQRVASHLILLMRLLGDVLFRAPQLKTLNFDLLLALSIKLESLQPLLITMAITSEHSQQVHPFKPLLIVRQ